MKRINFAVLIIVLMGFSNFVSAQQNNSNDQTQVKAVASLDLKRYAGKWFEIARYPNKFQKDCVGNTIAEYALKDGDKVEVLNSCITKNGTTDKAKGEGKITDKVSNAKLEVRFAPGFLSFLSAARGDYWVIDLDANYQYAAVGDPKREYLWILSRAPEMNDATYQSILRRVEVMGFNPGKLVKTPQGVEVIKGAVIRKQ
ncbi:MAG: lipocalin family protein [Acidobacteriota bacterium]|nr:lipocalin family protein [Acidobacteriota bacterium]MDQ3372678.1 lipocalin family protein [Acidobacteriota bacterium]